MKNPTNFFDTIKDSKNRMADMSKSKYEQLMLQQMVDLFDYTISDVRNAFYQSTSDDPLSDFKYKVNDATLDVLFMRKLKNQVIHSFIYKMDTTMAWKTFCRICDERKLPILGLIFPVKEHSHWIIHNMGLISVPGRGRIIVPSKRTELRDIVLEPLKFFIEGRKEIL